MSQRAVFLDRDGVINAYAYNPEFGTVDSPANPDEFALLPGAGQAITKLNEAGLLAIVVSNQPGIAKGRFTLKLLEAMTEKMKRLVAGAGGRLDAVYYCPHHPEGTIDGYRLACQCRKPSPGLLHQAAREWGIDLGQSYMVGDGVVDVLTGRQAGTRTVFVSPRKGYILSELERQNAWPDLIAGHLPQAVELIKVVENGHSHAPRVDRAERELASEGPAYTSAYITYASGSVQLQPGDLLFIFTDGVAEAVNEKGEEFGEARIIPAITSVSSGTAAAILKRVMGDVNTFVGFARQHDDITALVLRVTA